jgi:PAS domain S-box-containing protein
MNPLDLIAESGEAVFAIDSAQHIVFWNRPCEELLGYPAIQVLGMYCYRLIAGRDSCANQYCSRDCAAALQARKGKEDPVHPFPLSVRDAAGRPKRLIFSLALIPAGRDTLSAVAHVIREESTPPTNLGHDLANRTLQQSNPPWPLRSLEGHSIPLSDREKEVLTALARGLKTTEIGAELCVSRSTVRNHIQNIFQKLDVHSRLAATVYAFRHRLI